MKAIEIMISTPPPSPNVMLRMHHQRRHRVNKRIYLEVAVQIWEKVGRELPLFEGRPVLISAVRYAKRPLDGDNLVGSLKPAIDGLVRCGALQNDTPEHVRLGWMEQKKPNGGVERLVMRIEPL